jgi:hypothetical protein
MPTTASDMPAASGASAGGRQRPSTWRTWSPRAELGGRANVYVSARAFGEPRRSGAAALPARVLWADCDSRESAVALARFSPRPHIVVCSGRPGGGGLHAYWLLDRALPADELKALGVAIAERLGADPAAARPAQPTRVALTRNFKWPGAPIARILRFAAETPLAVECFTAPGAAGPEPRQARAQARPQAAVVLGAHADLKSRLKAISPAVYVPALLGRAPDARGYVLCPFPHPHSRTGRDENPSLRVHADGWHCYGCGRYGDIIALESELCGLGPAPSGRHYREILQRLAERFGLAGAPVAERAPRGAAERRDASPAEPRMTGPMADEADGGVGVPPESPADIGRDGRGGLRLAVAGVGRGAIAVPWLGNGVAIAVCGAAALLVLIAVVIAFGAVTLLGGRPQPDGGQYTPSAVAVRDIPPRYLRLYRTAGARYGLDWTVLAAVGKVECDHGRSPAVGCHRGEENPAGAAGPAQFLAGTWRRYGVDGDGDGRRDRWAPADAIFGMANYLRASGAPADYGRALYAYNHAAWYVQAVLAEAQRYRGAYLPPSPAALDGAAAPPAVLGDARILLSDPLQRADVAAGRIDPRVLGVLLWASADHALVVTALRSDHPRHTSAGSVSNPRGGTGHRHRRGRRPPLHRHEARDVWTARAAARAADRTASPHRAHLLL